MKRNPYLISTGQPAHRRPAERAGGDIRPITQNRKYAANREHTATGKFVADREYTTTGKPAANRTHTTSRMPAVNRQHAAARRRARLRKQRIRRLKFGILLALTGTMAVFAVVLAFKFFGRPDVDGSVMPGMTGVANALEDVFGEKVQGISALAYAKHPDWTEDFLTPNEFSRPGDSLGKVKNIFVHYTANPGTSAAQNRSYFEQLKDTQERSASAHFIIGYEGEIIQCVPDNEVAYASNQENHGSISIENCHLDSTGKFLKDTYISLVKLTAYLTERHSIMSKWLAFRT